MLPRKRYLDDTIKSIKPSSIPLVISALNKFNENIEFTFEEEKDGKIPFLDVLLIRRNDTLETTVYRKATHNGIYLHWSSFCPNSWKHGSLRSIISRAFDICSNEELLHIEIEVIKKEFLQKNGYPKWVFDQIYQDIKNKKNVVTDTVPTVDNLNVDTDEKRVHIISVPYKGDRGQKLMQSLDNTLLKVLHTGHVTKTVYTGMKLGSLFNIKDCTKFQHQNDLVYYTECPEKTCDHNYIGEVERRLVERVNEHGGKDNKSHVSLHSIKRGCNYQYVP